MLGSDASKLELTHSYMSSIDGIHSTLVASPRAKTANSFDHLKHVPTKAMAQFIASIGGSPSTVARCSDLPEDPKTPGCLGRVQTNRVQSTRTVSSAAISCRKTEMQTETQLVSVACNIPNPKSSIKWRELGPLIKRFMRPPQGSQELISIDNFLFLQARCQFQFRI